MCNDDWGTVALWVIGVVAVALLAIGFGIGLLF